VTDLKPSCIPAIERWLARGRGEVLRRARGADSAPRARPVRLVAGSPAADPDSLAASIAYAWLLRLGPRSGLVLPYVPIARADLRIRPEALELFGQAGLDPSGLLFADELEPGELGALAGLRLSLVDSDGAYLPQAARARVVEVLDHHPGGFSTPPDSPEAVRSVEPVGSACTLVAERYFRQRPEALDPELAVLLLGPILLDTAGLDPAAGRTSERDRAAAGRLADLAGPAAAGLHARLLEVRRDLPGLSSEELLRRDYKEGRAAGGRYGISSVPLSRERWGRRDGQRDRALARFREARALDLLLVMTGYVEQGPAEPPAGQPPAAFRRELALCAGGPRLAARAEAFLRSLPLELHELPGESPGVRWFRQGATELSRKRLEPLLGAWLQREGPP
jgi:exopolyphosphatase